MISLLPNGREPDTNIFKRARRRDVIFPRCQCGDPQLRDREKGTRSQHFVIAVQRMLQLLDEMEEALRASLVGLR
jgi:hypothetical protein